MKTNPLKYMVSKLDVSLFLSVFVAVLCPRILLAQSVGVGVRQGVAGVGALPCSFDAGEEEQIVARHGSADRPPAYLHAAPPEPGASVVPTRPRSSSVRAPRVPRSGRRLSTASASLMNCRAPR